ncbi:MAG TPA: SPFH domain-containing protein [Alphaproteobacteria bacterium]
MENTNRFRIPLPANPLARWGTAAAFGAVAGLGIWQSVVVTNPNEVTMILTGGAPSGFAPVGLSLKIPFLQSTFSKTTSVQELQVPKSSIGLQNGTMTAEGLESSIFIRFNGTFEERQKTLELVRANMPDLEERVKSLAEGSLREVVRLAALPAEDISDGQTVTVQPAVRGAINFMDSAAIGDAVAAKVQNDINSIIPGSVIEAQGTDAERSAPRIEVVQVRIGNWEWDASYTNRRQIVADARSNAEAARYKKAEAERSAEAAVAAAEGNKKAAILAAEGQAEGIRLVATAEADGLKARIEAAGGSETLIQQTLAEKWQGVTPSVVGGENVIVDGRYAPGVKFSDVTPVTAVPSVGMP